ncbi:MAG: hypothetical protein ABSB67_10090 [Bryobacteraceae bacterium]|jgi:hypothetical protein
MIDKPFIGFVDDEKQACFVNLLQARHVIHGYKDGKEFCTLIFSETHRITFQGPTAIHFIKRLMERGVALNGEEFKNIEQVGSTPQSSMVAPED